jgi:hypothetical protein
MFQVKETKAEEAQRREEEEEKEDEAEAAYDALKSYKDILNLLKPGTCGFIQIRLHEF